MADMRTALPVGTRITLHGGNLYEITGSPIGSGGGGFVYPAARLYAHEQGYVRDGIVYALKECFPVSYRHTFIRDRVGRVVPESGSPEEWTWLRHIQQMVLAERQITQQIYRTGYRIHPILESAQRITMERPGTAPAEMDHAFTVMESLSEKGQSLESYRNSLWKMPTTQVFSVIRQVLFVLREIHRAGYLHLDIQAGNTFVKGAHGDDGDLITLIDFGCARPLTDGKTAPVTDRVILCTDGYTAPEIRLQNDGTLRLGPEADLYSVGCLLLFLLTGKRCDEKRLLRNRTGVYLSGWDRKRLDCPGYLMERMQSILARALEKNPEDRYHSADQMLEDVTAFLEALQPYRSDLKGMKYDAFISYKHGPIDSTVARVLQQQLEHYRAPGGISEQKQPFRRVFVDEGELSSGMDYGQWLRQVLRNSGWLIVICSPDTPHSEWVQKEISMFLEYHDRSRILAVMTGGNPPEIFPQVLRNQGELLAADARGDGLKSILKKLKQNALPELAAPMLGVDLDALKQRRKLYVMKRIFAASTAALTALTMFSLYALKQNKQIQQEHRSALISQSRYLAQQALRELERHDPIAAVELALAAIPTGNTGLPMPPEAELVMTRVLNAYQTEESAQFSAGATGVIRHESGTPEPGFFAVPEETTLFTWDDQAIYLWDSETCQRKQIIQTAQPVSILRRDLIQPERQTMIFAASGEVGCIDYANGQDVWRFAPEEGGSILGVAFSGATGNTVCVTEKCLYVLDAGGSVILRLELTLPGTVRMDQIALSKDGKKCAFAYCPESEEMADTISDVEYHYESYNSRNDGIALVDLESGTVRHWNLCAGLIRTITFDDSHRVWIGGMRGHQYRVVYENGSVEWQENCEATALMLEWDGTEPVWSQSYDCPITVSDVRLLEIPGSEDLLFHFADRVVRLNRTEGTVVQRWEFPSNIVQLNRRADGFNAVTADGSIHLAYYGQEQWHTIPLFNSNLIACATSGTSFYVQYGNWTLHPENQIIRYQYAGYDPNWVCLAEGCGISGFVETFLEDGVLAVAGEGPVVLCADTSLDQPHLIRLPEQIPCPLRIQKILGVREIDGKRVLLAECTDGCETEGPGYQGILLIDVASGAAELRHLPEPGADVGFVQETAATEQGIWMLVKSHGYSEAWAHEGCTEALYFWDCERDSLTREVSWKIETCNESSVSEMRISADVASALLVHTDYGNTAEESRVSLQLIDLKKGTVSTCLSIGAHPSATAQQDGLWAVCINGEITVRNRDGSVVCAIGPEGESLHVESMSFSPTGNLLVLYRDRLVSYRLPDGRAQGAVDLTEESLALYDVRWYYPEEEELVLCAGSAACVVDLSEEMFGLRALVSDAFGYDARTGRFYTAERSGLSVDTVGYFPRYTTEELIQMSRRLLGHSGDTPSE